MRLSTPFPTATLCTPLEWLVNFPDKDSDNNIIDKSFFLKTSLKLLRSLRTEVMDTTQDCNKYSIEQNRFLELASKLIHSRKDNIYEIALLHQSIAASSWWCGPRPRLGWVKMAVGLLEGPSYPGHSPSFFSLCCPLNDRRRAAHSFFKIGHLFSLFLFSCPSLALLRLLILLLLLMSGNVHPNPGPIFPCSVCTGNVTWRGKSVQFCACSKWVHLRCSQLSFSQFKALGSYHSWIYPPC